jgi:hypothetical protein
MQEEINIDRFIQELALSAVMQSEERFTSKMIMFTIELYSCWALKGVDDRDGTNHSSTIEHLSSSKNTEKFHDLGLSVNNEHFDELLNAINVDVIKQIEEIDNFVKLLID